ncbi:pentapeptide repeat-containing protein [Nitrosopumilus sp.]|nr:pentapeptide repeat-containing protein [Nitrosopumilus sp.]
MIGKAVIIGIVFVAIFLVVIVPNTHIPIGLGPIYDIPSTVTNQINDKVEEHNDEVDRKEFLNSLKKQNLSNLDLSEKNIEGHDFSGKNLSDTNFEYANLEGSDFRGANLSDTNFESANLEGSDFRGANLSDTNFESANLRGSDFSNTDIRKVESFRNTKMSLINFQGSNFSGMTIFDRCGGCDFSNANMRNIGISGGKIIGSDFSNTNLSGAKLSYVYIHEGDFSNTNLKNSILTDVLFNTDISDIDLSGAKLLGISLHDSNKMQNSIRDSKVMQSLSCDIKWKMNTGKTPIGQLHFPIFGTC